LLSLT